jgi:hypothetical protein
VWIIGGIKTGREKVRYSEKNLPYCHYVLQKSLMDRGEKLANIISTDQKQMFSIHCVCMTKLLKY